MTYQRTLYQLPKMESWGARIPGNLMRGTEKAVGTFADTRGFSVLNAKHRWLEEDRFNYAVDDKVLHPDSCGALPAAKVSRLDSGNCVQFAFGDLRACVGGHNRILTVYRERIARVVHHCADSHTCPHHRHL